MLPSTLSFFDNPRSLEGATFLLFIIIFKFTYRQICQLYLGKHTVTCLLADNSNTGGTAVNIFNSFPDKGHALLIISAGFTVRKEKH